MHIINGQKLSKEILSDLKTRVQKLHFKPKLAIILVGDRPDSLAYVKMKKRTAEKVGIQCILIHFKNEDILQNKIIDKIIDLNANLDIHGIMVQLPLPDLLNEYKILSHIALEKDVDGLNPLNLAKLANSFNKTYRSANNIDENHMFISCTPKGCMYILDSLDINLVGKSAVVLGRSNMVGIPMLFLLMQRRIDVISCDKDSVNTKKLCQCADIIISATGKPHLIDDTWIKSGAIIIDVGYSYIPDVTRKSGKRLVGDVNFELVKDKASYITPVPNGVGPMTISMLLENTYIAASLTKPISLSIY